MAAIKTGLLRRAGISLLLIALVPALAGCHSNLSIKTLAISPNPVAQGQYFQVIVEMKNGVGVTRTETVTLHIDNVEEAHQSITVDHDDTAVITFTASRVNLGLYSVKVISSGGDFINSQFTVVATPGATVSSNSLPAIPPSVIIKPPANNNSSYSVPSQTAPNPPSVTANPPTSTTTSNAPGSIRAWGLGFGRMPVTFPGLTGITFIAAGSNFSLAVKSNDTVWAWGSNATGNLGDNSKIDRQTPVQVQGLTGVKGVATGEGFSLAVKSDGTVWAWGRNNAGQLGNGTQTESLVPVKVSGLTNIVSVAAGSGIPFSLALRNDGTIWAWGSNIYGQLGDGSDTAQRLTPVQVQGLTGVVGISAGGTFSLAVTSDGKVWAWGANHSGALGTGDNLPQNSPTQVSGLSNVTKIAAGFSFNTALKNDGTVWAWGNNEYRQLGDGTKTHRLTPVQVQGLSGTVTSIASGGDHSLAIMNDGTVWAWGANNQSQLGDNTISERLTPVRTSVLTGTITSVSAGFWYSLAIVQ